MIEKLNIPESSTWEEPEIFLARKLNEIIDVVNARQQHGVQYSNPVRKNPPVTVTTTDGAHWISGLLGDPNE